MCLPQWDVLNIVDTGVVRCLHVLVNKTASSTSEGLNSKVLAFLHFGLVSSLDNGHRLASMNLVRVDRVSIQVADRFD